MKRIFFPPTSLRRTVYLLWPTDPLFSLFLLYFQVSWFAMATKRISMEPIITKINLISPNWLKHIKLLNSWLEYECMPLCVFLSHSVWLAHVHGSFNSWATWKSRNDINRTPVYHRGICLLLGATDRSVYIWTSRSLFSYHSFGHLCVDLYLFKSEKAENGHQLFAFIFIR